MFYIGYDIGGTKCAVSLGRVEGDKIEIMGRRMFATGGAPLEVLGRMADEAEALLNDSGLAFSDVTRAGISCGGPLDSARAAAAETWRS